MGGRPDCESLLVFDSDSSIFWGIQYSCSRVCVQAGLGVILRMQEVIRPFEVLARE